MYTPKGKFGWYELMTSDTDAAAEFYSRVVGWTTQKMADNDPPYTVFNVTGPGTGVAGMVQIPGHVSWVGYISVADVDAHIPEVILAGGKLLRPATDVPGVLRFAVMSDPQGAAFVLFTPNPDMPTPENRPEPPARGTISWNELYTTDLEAAWTFYEAQFGWTKVNDMDMGPMGTYRLFDQAEGKPMGSGGMMLKPPQVPVAHWAFYFQVDNITAAAERVKSAGGSILNGPMPIPGGGFIIQAQDPQGTHFSLVSDKEN